MRNNNFHLCRIHKLLTRSFALACSDRVMTLSLNISGIFIDCAQNTSLHTIHPIITLLQTI